MVISNVTFTEKKFYTIKTSQKENFLKKARHQILKQIINNLIVSYDSEGSGTGILLTFPLEKRKLRGGSRTAATSKMELFVIIVNYYHKVLHLGCCSSPISASETMLE